MARGKAKRNLGFVSSVLWLINLVLALVLAASYLSSWVDPNTTTLFAFLGLAYPYLLVANIVFLLFWLFRGRRRLLLSLVAILLGYVPLTRYIQLMPGEEAPEDQELLKVLTYNVQNMSHSNLGQANEEIRSRIYGFLRSQEADIVCLQEFSSEQADTGVEYEELLIHTGYQAYHVANYTPRRNRSRYGMIMLSNLPFISSGSLNLPGDQHNFGMYTELLSDTDTIRVYNLHLESIRLQHEDYRFVEDVSRGQTESGALGEGSKSILRKLHTAYQVRARQARIVRENIDQCPHKVIVCGDFNDTPQSYAYNKIAAGLQDGFVEAGFGRGSTFEGKLPSLRIDFILYSDYFRAYQFEVHPSQLSDHYPVTVYLGK